MLSTVGCHVESYRSKERSLGKNWPVCKQKWQEMENPKTLVIQRLEKETF